MNRLQPQRDVVTKARGRVRLFKTAPPSVWSTYTPTGEVRFQQLTLFSDGGTNRPWTVPSPTDETARTLALAVMRWARHYAIAESTCVAVRALVNLATGGAL